MLTVLEGAAYRKLARDLCYNIQLVLGLLELVWSRQRFCCTSRVELLPNWAQP